MAQFVEESYESNPDARIPGSAIHDRHRLDEHGRLDMLSAAGIQRVVAASELIDDCLEAACRGLLTTNEPIHGTGPDHGSDDQWAYHQLAFLAEGKWNPPGSEA